MVFCAFHNAFKITRPVFRCWMRILAGASESVLWLSTPPDEVRRRLVEEATRCGIGAERLIFAPKVAAVEDHLARQRAADLLLDVMPYNAHSTAAEALWVGLPVLTMTGESFAGRVATSLLHAVGLGELATDSLSRYEELAVDLAHDSGRLGELRRHLDAVRQTSPLFRSDRQVRALEAACLRMAEIARAGEGPCSFDLEAAP